jgi:hypothetical protein
MCGLEAVPDSFNIFIATWRNAGHRARRCQPLTHDGNPMSDSPADISAERANDDSVMLKSLGPPGGRAGVRQGVRGQGVMPMSRGAKQAGAS